MKKKLIACIIACATLLMGTGFAYWTDIININATAKTGYLEVKFTEAKDTGNNFKPTNLILPKEEAYDKTTRNAKVLSSDQVSIDITNLYPGHYETFKVTAENAGTVAAKLGKVKATAYDVTNDEISNMIGIAIDAESEYVIKHGIFGLHITDDVDINLPKDSTFKIGKRVFVRLSALEDVLVNEQPGNMIYLTNNSNMEFTIEIAMDPDASGTYTTGSAAKGNPNSNVDADTQNANASVKLQFVWDQYNEQ